MLTSLNNGATSKHQTLQNKMEKKGKIEKAATKFIPVLVFIALIWLAGSTIYIFKLQQDINNLKQINGSPQNTPQKLTGAAKKNKTEDDTERAAHLTGKATAQHSDRLMWDIRMGNAFMQGFTYRNGTLIINKTGKYYIYSKIHFRGENCPLMPLHQTILKHDNTYQLDQTLMRVQEINFCSGHGLWRKTTFQAGIFHLKRGVQLFVQVSDPTMVSLDELMTFFGIYKI
ncbi:tumor necrosis factor ligand superfamily member 6-like isoform X2 [Hypanus sabinus]|uniref:tumor necrosis factor ligand superfamily member 6-like isoform X2 n=1 Tax=Hypanus sabinus TaxID=79690 RepID=UPI0028C484EA|nr:tumor necrosis factor ligand superfamily member 6-like isoform X2 [Hypanus sabinus]